MASLIFTYGLSKYLDGTNVLGTTSLDMMLLKSSYTPSKKHRFVSEISAHEVNTGSGYTRKTLGVVSGSIDDTNNSMYINTPSDLVWTGVSGFTCRYIAIYKNSGVDSTSTLIFLIDLLSDRTPTSSITWHPISGNVMFVLSNDDPVITDVTINYTNGGKLKLMDGTINFLSNTLKIMMLKTSYSFTSTEIDKDDCSSMTASEASGTGYTGGYGGSGRKTITNKTVTVDDNNDRVVLDFDIPDSIDVDSIGDLGYAVLIKETGGSDATAIPIAIFKPAQILRFASRKGDMKVSVHNAGAIHFKEQE